MSMLGIIGGTGLAALEGLEVERQLASATPWGMPSAPLLAGRLGARPLLFLARHGGDHGIPPHAVNYRANIWALRAAGAVSIVAVNAVGGLHAPFDPGMLAVPDQLIDYTWGRAHTFCEGDGQPLQHVDFTAPYSASLRVSLLAAGARAGLSVHDGGVYGVTQGPRLETAAEIDRMARDGCDLVGMTGMPEAGLARELGLEYACLAVVVNRAAGRGADIHAEFERWVAEGVAKARRLLAALVAEALVHG
jgi:5'-methylthioinosine phosphorylase